MKQKWFQRLLTVILSALIVVLCLWTPGSRTAAPAVQEPSAASAPADVPQAEPSGDFAPAEMPAPETPPATPELPASGSDLYVPLAVPNVMVLNGTTGFGMAQFMDADARRAGVVDCEFTVETDAANITAALVNGSCDIAALPTNAAAALYHKTGGAVQCLALNTRGVIYLVAGEGETVASLSDLEGRTVYVPAQNPTFLFSALCEKAGVSVTIDNTYAQPADLRTAVAAGLVSLAVLPEPMVTIACSANDALTVALDLTAEWDKVFPTGSLVQGCLVVRKAFAEENPKVVDLFLDDYAASVAFLTEDLDAAADMIVSAGLLSAAPVAKTAIPRCNVCCLTGGKMQQSMNDFINIMLTYAPNSVGGTLPGNDFYCEIS